MKKILLLIALVAGFATGMRATDQVTAKVSGTALNIGLVNETTYCAFQMDITLPDGVSATEVAAAANRLSQEGSDTEIGGTKFIVASNTLSGNVLRVIAYNLNNAEIAGTSGDDILNITLGATVADPTTIKVSNILFVKASSLAEVTLPNATGERGTLIGDINKSGEVNLNDLICLLRILQVGKDDPSCADYDKVAADVNKNGEINLNDLVALINIIK